MINKSYTRIELWLLCKYYTNRVIIIVYYVNIKYKTNKVIIIIIIVNNKMATER